MLRVADAVGGVFPSLIFYIMYPPPDVVRDVRGVFMDRGLVVWKMTVEKADLVKLRFPEYPMFLLYLLKL